MRENCTSGTVQGAPGNRRSYCERRACWHSIDLRSTGKQEPAFMIDTQRTRPH